MSHFYSALPEPPAQVHVRELTDIEAAVEDGHALQKPLQSRQMYFKHHACTSSM